MYPIERDLEIVLLNKESLGELSDTSDGEDRFFCLNPGRDS